MAGSYEHLLAGWDMIGDMGDAAEAIEELMWLVESQIGENRARELLEAQFYPMVRREVPKDNSFKKVMELMDK